MSIHYISTKITQRYFNFLKSRNIFDSFFTLFRTSAGVHHQNWTQHEKSGLKRLTIAEKSLSSHTKHSKLCDDF